MLALLASVVIIMIRTIMKIMKLLALWRHQCPVPVTVRPAPCAFLGI